MSTLATDNRQRNRSNQQQENAVTLQVNLRSLNLREDIFQMRYKSSKTRLSNFPNKRALTKFISINLNKRNARNSIGSKGMAASPHHQPGRTTNNPRSMTTQSVDHRFADGSTKTHNKQTIGSVQDSTFDSRIGSALDPKPHYRYTRNRKIQSIDLTTVLREQPNLLMEHTKKFQAIRMKQFSPPNNPNLPISSNTQSARNSSGMRSTANRQRNETVYAQKFNWPIINSQDYARTSCTFSKNQAGTLGIQHPPKHHQRNSLNRTALAHQSLMQSTYVHSPIEKSSKVIEEESRAETPAVNLQARLTSGGSIFDQKSKQQVEDYVDDGASKFQNGKKVAVDTSDNKSKIILSKTSNIRQSPPPKQKPDKISRQIRRPYLSNKAADANPEANFSEELKKYDGYSYWQMNTNGQGSSEKSVKFENIENQNRLDQSNTIEQYRGNRDSTVNQVVSSSPQNSKQDAATRGQSPRPGNSMGLLNRDDKAVAKSVDIDDEFGMVEMVEADSVSPHARERVQSPLQLVDTLKDTLEAGSANKKHFYSPKKQASQLQKSAQSEQSEASITKVANITRSNPSRAGTAGVNTTGFQVDMSLVNQVNVFDQTRISYLNKQMEIQSPRLEDNLQIKKIEVPSLVTSTSRRKERPTSQQPSGEGPSPGVSPKEQKARQRDDGLQSPHLRTKSLGSDNSVGTSLGPRSPMNMPTQPATKAHNTKNNETQYISKQSINSNDQENLEPTHEFDKNASTEDNILTKDDDLNGQSSQQYQMQQKKEKNVDKDTSTDHQGTSGAANDYLIGIQLKYSNIQMQQDQNSDANKVFLVQTKSVGSNGNQGHAGKLNAGRINSDLITTFKDDEMEAQNNHKQKLKVLPQRTDVTSGGRSKDLNDSSLQGYKMNRIVTSLPSQTPGNYNKDGTFYQQDEQQQVARELDSGNADGSQNMANNLSNRGIIFMPNSIFQNEKSYPELEKKNLQVEQIISSKSKDNYLKSNYTGSISGGILVLADDRPESQANAQHLSCLIASRQSKRNDQKRNSQETEASNFEWRRASGCKLTESLLHNSIDLKSQIQNAMHNMAQSQEQEGIFGKQIKMSSLSRYQNVAAKKHSITKQMCTTNQFIETFVAPKIDQDHHDRRAQTSHRDAKPTGPHRNNGILYDKQRETPCKGLFKGEQSLVASNLPDDDLFPKMDYQQNSNTLTNPVGRMQAMNQLSTKQRSSSNQSSAMRQGSRMVQEGMLNNQLANQIKNQNPRDRDADLMPDSSSNLQIRQKASEYDQARDVGEAAGGSPGINQIDEEKNIHVCSNSIDLRSWASSNGNQNYNNGARNIQMNTDQNPSFGNYDTPLDHIGNAMAPAGESAESSNLRLFHKISTLRADPLQAIEGLGRTVFESKLVNQGLSHENISISNKNQNIQFKLSRQIIGGTRQQYYQHNKCLKDSVVLQDNCLRTYNLSALESSLNQNLAQTLIVEHARNQGKINLENGVKEIVLDINKGSKAEAKLAASDVAVVPSIPSRYPAIPDSLPKKQPTQGQLSSGKNQFLSIQKRQKLKDLHRSTHISNISNNKNDIQSEISKLTNTQLIEAQIKNTPNFGLSNKQSDQRQADNFEIKRRDHPDDPNSQHAGVSEQGQSPIDMQLDSINEQIFSYRQDHGQEVKDSKGRYEFGRNQNGMHNIKQLSQIKGNPNGDYCYTSVRRQSRIELKMDSGGHCSRLHTDLANTERNKDESHVEVFKSDAAQSTKRETPGCQIIVGRGPQIEYDNDAEPASSQHDYSMQDKPNGYQSPNPGQRQAKDEKESQKTLQTMETPDNQDVSEQMPTPLLRPKQDIGKSIGNYGEKLKLDADEIEQALRTQNKTNENEKNETNRSNVLSKYPTSGHGRNRRNLTHIKEAKKEQSTADLAKTVEASTTPMQRPNLRNVEDEIGGLLIDSYTGIDDIHGELRNVLEQQDGDQDNFRLNLQQIPQYQSMSDKKMAKKPMTAQSISRIFNSSFDRQLVQKMLKYQGEVQESPPRNDEQRGSNPSRLSPENQENINVQNQRLDSNNEMTNKDVKFDVDQAQRKRILNHWNQSDEPDISMNEQQLQLIDELQTIAYAAQNGLELPHASRQSARGKRNLRYSTDYNSIDFSQQKASKFGVGHKQKLDDRRRRSVLYDDQQSYHAASMRQSLMKNHHEMMVQKREQSRSVIEQYGPARNDITSIASHEVGAEAAWKLHDKPNAQKSVRFKELPDPIIDPRHIAARSRSQLAEDYPNTRRSSKKWPGGSPDKTFKHYCQSLEHQARVDNSYQTLDPGQNSDHLLFRKQFKNFKCYMPGEGSQKHGEIRRMDSREIMDLVQQYQDEGLDIDFTDEMGGYLPRRMKLSYRDSGLGGQLRLDLENRAFRLKLAHTTDYRQIQRPMCCDLPQLKVRNEFGEDLKHPYFNHRVDAGKIAEKLQAQYFTDQEKRRSSARGTSQQSAKSSKARSPKLGQTA